VLCLKFSVVHVFLCKRAATVWAFACVVCVYVYVFVCVYQVRTGGKGTVRRKKKAVHKTASTDDKRLQVD